MFTQEYITSRDTVYVKILNYVMYLMNKNIRFYNGTYQIFYSTIYPIDPPNPPDVNRNWRKYN